VIVRTKNERKYHFTAKCNNNRSNQKRWNCSISKFFLQFNYFLRNTLVKCFSINRSNSNFYIKTKQNTQLGMSYKWKSYSELFKAFFILNCITRFERNINIVKDDVEIKITKNIFFFSFSDLKRNPSSASSSIPWPWFFAQTSKSPRTSFTGRQEDMGSVSFSKSFLFLFIWSKLSFFWLVTFSESLGWNSNIYFCKKWSLNQFQFQPRKVKLKILLLAPIGIWTHDLIRNNW